MRCGGSACSTAIALEKEQEGTKIKYGTAITIQLTGSHESYINLFYTSHVNTKFSSGFDPSTNGECTTQLSNTLALRPSTACTHLVMQF